MATSETLINKAGQIADFTAGVRNLINTATLWHTGATGAGQLIEADLGTTRASWGLLESYLGGGKDPSGPTEASLTDASVSASVLVNSFQTWARQYTRVRNFRFIRTGNIYGTRDVTRITHLNNTFVQADVYPSIDSTAAENNIVQGANITAANFNAFITSLYNKWNTQKNNTHTYSVDYCHSNCHSSCHSSTRWRR